MDAYDLADRLDLDAPSEAVLRKLDRVIADTVAQVEGYLGRSITPTEVTKEHLLPGWDGGFDLDDDVRKIVDISAEIVSGQPTGFFTVKYETGLDWINDPDLSGMRAWIGLAAENSPAALRLWRSANQIERGPIKSVSTEGQSVSYGEIAGRGGGGAPGSGAPGAVPLISSLDRWKMRTAYQGPSRANLPWMHP